MAYNYLTQPVMGRVKDQYDLECRYDSQKSFYGKAVVKEMEDGILVLQSYVTYVAEISADRKSAKVNGWYSLTTGHHIKEFLKQNGFFADNKKQILREYFKCDEYCSHCGSTVEIYAYRKNPCPNCGVIIKPCSMCDMEKVSCEKCKLDKK